MGNHGHKVAPHGLSGDISGANLASPDRFRGSKRDRILEAGLKLFANESYQAVTMDRVAEAAGVAKGTLYLYFQSKEDLYLGILSDGMETMARTYQSTVEPHADAKTRLRHAIAVTVEFYAQRRDLLRLMMTEEPKMPEGRNRLRDEWRERGGRVFTALVEEGIGSGAFRPVDPHLVTYAILGSMRSVMLFYGARRPIEQIGHELGEMLVRAVSAEPHSNHRRVSHQS